MIVIIFLNFFPPKAVVPPNASHPGQALLNCDHGSTAP